VRGSPGAAAVICDKAGTVASWNVANACRFIYRLARLQLKEAVEESLHGPGPRPQAGQAAHEMLIEG
jgi:hypothetical protein